MRKKRLIGTLRRPPAQRRPRNSICSWCGRNLGLLPYDSYQPSFGICEECVVRNFAYLYDPPIGQEMTLGNTQADRGH